MGGRCISTYHDGRIYDGEYENGHQTGQGTLIFRVGSSKAKYVGGFVNGLMNGHGTLTFRDGTVYVGDFANDAANGHGRRRGVRGDATVQHEGHFGDGAFVGECTSDYRATCPWVPG